MSTNFEQRMAHLRNRISTLIAKRRSSKSDGPSLLSTKSILSSKPLPDLPSEIIHTIIEYVLDSALTEELHTAKRARDFAGVVLGLAVVSTGFFRKVYLGLEDHCLWLHRVRMGQHTSDPAYRDCARCAELGLPAESAMKKHLFVEDLWKRLTRLYEEKRVGQRTDEKGCLRNILGGPVKPGAVPMTEVAGLHVDAGFAKATSPADSGVGVLEDDVDGVAALDFGTLEPRGSLVVVNQ